MARHRSRHAISPLPRWTSAIGILACAYLLLPLILMVGRTSWASLPGLLSSDTARDALLLSARTCVAALAIDLVVGIPAALLLARDWRGVRVARIIVALPLSLPPVVAGIALLSAFGRRSLLGSSLETLGVSIAFTTVAVVMAQVFVSLPFLIVTLEAALRSRPRGLEEIASSLGAGPSRVLFRVTLPQVTPALARGSALALARCLGEFGATLTFAGSLQGVTRTLPLQIYLARESDSDLAIALGVVLLFVAAVVVAATEIPGHLRLERTAPKQQDLPEPAARREIPSPGASNTPGVDGVDAAQESEGVAPDDDANPRNEVSVIGAVDDRHWRVDVHISPGSVTAVMGRNGAGKSTLAQVIAGLLPLDSGSVIIGGDVVDGKDSFVPARLRSVAYVSQQPHVFPNMSVLENVMFPLRARGIDASEARLRAAAQLEAVACPHLADRRGHALSGGQAALVSLARAFVFEPRVLILDEPTAALDVETSARVTRTVARMLRGTSVTTLLVTHDPLEALSLADHLIVLEDNAVVESASPAAVLASPSSVFGARLAGFNVLTGEGYVDDDGLLSVRVGEARVASSGDPQAAGEEIAMLFSPDSVAISCTRPGGSPRSVIPASIDSVEFQGRNVEIAARVSSGTTIRASITAAAWTELSLAVGDRVWCSIKATQVRPVVLSRARLG